MNEPVKQHYIPQSYLRHFATKDRENFLVDVYDPKVGTRLRQQNISAICFKRHLYTLDNVPSENRYFVEKFYAQQVDTHFTTIHKTLTDPNIQYISAEEKEMIISSLLSLFFRTTKFLHASFYMYERIIDEVVTSSKNDEIKISFDNIKYSFKKNEVDQFKYDLKEEHRLAFVLSHIDHWHDFYKRKLKNGIQVCKIVDDVQLITSDNPVIIDSYDGGRFHLYNPKNIIQIPIDKHHYLFLLPDEEEVDPLFIARGDRDKWFALTTNKLIEDKSERWIISDLDGIDAHIEQQEKYNKRTVANNEEVNKMHERASHFLNIKKLSDKHNGNMLAPEVIKLVDEYSTLEIFKDDPTFWQFYKSLKNTG